MRRLVSAFATIVLVVLALMGEFSPGIAQGGNADTVMAAARTALGGDARIGAVKTFIANGRTRQVRGDNLVPIEFEIQAELPDKYSRRDEFPQQDQGPVTAGFAGEALVLIPRPAPPPPRPGAPASASAPQSSPELRRDLAGAASGREGGPPPGQQEAMLRNRLMQAKQEFARLMLGMFASSTAALPLTFSFVGQAEAPQGKADVVDAKGPNNFAARLFIAADTHLPIMLSWSAAAREQSGELRRDPAVAASGREGGAATAPKPQPEQRMFFADYRDVDGLKLPFRIRRGAGSETTEETTFDRYRINVRIDPRRFDTTAQ